MSSISCCHQVDSDKLQNFQRTCVQYRSKVSYHRLARRVSFETRLSQVHWKYQCFTFVDIQTCFVYYLTDLRGRHDFHSHQQCVCTMCAL